MVKKSKLRTRELCSSALVALSADLARADIAAATAAVNPPPRRLTMTTETDERD
jgi:hypothetical protein